MDYFEARFKELNGSRMFDNATPILKEDALWNLIWFQPKFIKKLKFYWLAKRRKIENNSLIRQNDVVKVNCIHFRGYFSLLNHSNIIMCVSFRDRLSRLLHYVNCLHEVYTSIYDVEEESLFKFSKSNFNLRPQSLFDEIHNSKSHSFMCDLSHENEWIQV